MPERAPSLQNPQVEAFFSAMEAQFLDLTPADIVLHPIATEYRRDQVDLTTRLTTGVELRAPIVSAAMDTVTMADMAIALAKEGGIGIIHGNLTAEEKRDEARRVKLHLNGIIEKPICAKTGQTIHSLMEECAQRGFDFRTFPVVDPDGKLQGVLTNHNLRFWNGSGEQTVSELMTDAATVVSAPAGTDIATAYDQMYGQQLNTLPLVGGAGEVAGLYIWSDVKRIHTGNPESYALDHGGHLLVGVAINTRPEVAASHVEATQDYCDVYVIDSSHGNSKDALDTLLHLRKTYGDGLQIIAGNIVDPQSAILLADAGASAIKVGIGGGAICTTRDQTGNGMGQLSAVYSVAKALRDNEFDIPVITDGGIVHPGDAAKLLAVGAEPVMMGSALAGTDEAPGDLITNKAGQPTKIYRGMGSLAAQESGREARGYSSGQGDVFSEGVVAQVPYKGAVGRVLFDFKAGIRNAVANGNADTLSTFRQNARIGRISSAGALKGSPHIGETGEIISN
ncbi:IMP dehydrogenase [Candidatus Saccharibacteria bacterium]|nr:IMP dehydrogenase [Candidatus Saccharibacteria bacterium]